MKKSFLLLLATVFLAGCAHYDVTLNNGTKLVNVYRPKLVKPKSEDDVRMYSITSVTGNKKLIPASKIAVIEPHQKTKTKLKNASGTKFDESQFIQ